MNELKLDEDVARAIRMQARNYESISTIIMLLLAPFAVSAYASLWSLAWRLIP